MHKGWITVAAAGMALSLAACKKTDDIKPNFKAAIDSYYETHPACLWPAPKQFPVQVGHDDPAVTQYDALVDQDLLARSTSEKKIIIVSKRENNYDISNRGRDAWTADTAQPGYGNFCYGHRVVSSIDSYSPTSGQPGATTTVQYHFTFTGAPDWAKSAEVQTAFPQVRTNLVGAPQAATATLTDTSNGWQMTPPTPLPVQGDAGIVQ